MAIWLRNTRQLQNGAADDPGSTRVGAPAEIMGAAEFGALVALDEGFRVLHSEREAVLAAAREEAARLVDAGRAEAAGLIEQARRERETAAAEGYREGEQRALADWFERTVQEGDAHARLLERMRERLAAVVSVAVEKVVSVEQRGLLFERALSEIDRIAGGATYLNIAVHPNDHDHACIAFDRLAARWREIGQAFPLSIVADRRLAPGSCIAESDFGTVDASLETQLRAMRSAVSRALKHAALDAERHSSGSPEEGGAPSDQTSEVHST
ncbi:type III secretion system stator protein SctL [Paraburkholderia unamae]|uniref:Type III secretion system stator protein SctL n=1 Tax=Paraburkholderia unamae TaxID=219649 RepID=A0ACC6RVS9_9BURK